MIKNILTKPAGHAKAKVRLVKIFISYAFEDKDIVARPLANALIDAGYRVWYDEYSIVLGDSLKRIIDEGLVKCDYAIIILSKSFFAKHWTREELDGITAIESTRGEKVLLPIWHDVDNRYVALYSPTLAGKKAINFKSGLESVVSAIREAINADSHTRYVSRNDLEFVEFPGENRDITFYKDFAGALVGARIFVFKKRDGKWLDLWKSLRPEFEKLDKNYNKSIRFGKRNKTR